MAGRGPTPKDPARRARRNKDPQALTVFEATPSTQPDLPTRYKVRKDEDGDDWDQPVDWPTSTREWWAMWGRSPMATSFTEVDWSELLIAAFLHAEFMEGNYKVASELRLRTAKFGATAEDRLRLRMQFAIATDAELGAVEKKQRIDSRARRAGVAARRPASEVEG
ncbi:hypothetical protein [Homoserinibacter sp. GY 40078]|uniref:phage terminase small subunit n=1 Tax=Homoserinibacter sp. GY 40078 TaxID=2603275 RepID=UPI0011C7767F|nr:hypothetical protein [Homoserinibacter sp. GY 40078]TXK17396.1 hypothetical protein FVQ89_11215 [Homoserinibacter sp. GY 40078]